MLKVYGGYGVMVNTEVCGTFDSGSIPDSHPTITSKTCSVLRLYFWSEYRELKDGGSIQDERSECLSPSPGRNARSEATMRL